MGNVLMLEPELSKRGSPCYAIGIFCRDWTNKEKENMAPILKTAHWRRATSRIEFLPHHGSLATSWCTTIDCKI